MFGFLLAMITAFVPADVTPINRARGYQISCDTTAIKMSPASGIGSPSTGGPGFQSFKFWNNTTTLVYVGGSDVDTTKGIPYCTTAASCPQSFDSYDGNPAGFWCYASGATTVTILAGNK